MAHCYKSAIRPDIIAHSAASQRGREGRRKRWGKVCVTIKNLLYFLQEADHQYFQICYTYSQILCFLISWLGKEAYGYSNEGRFDSAGIWTVFCSGHHKGNEKTYGIEGTYIHGICHQSRKLDRVPKEAVEELLGITFPDKQN